MKKLLVLFVFSITFIFIVNPVFASRRLRVLGASTTTADLSMPPTVEGPGIFLPDSPFFFLDSIKQNLRLLFAFTPEQKAKVHTDIAGERLAELRFMLAKNNESGIRTDLQGISDNLSAAAKSVSDAQFSGKNVSSLAKEINQNIKAKQGTLDSLELRSIGEMRAQIKFVSESLADAKIEVENSLPEDELESEIQDDLNYDILKEVTNASNSAEELKFDLDELNKQASEAAQKSLARREEMLKKTISKKNEVLIKTTKDQLENEKKKQQELYIVQGQAAEQARFAIQKAQEAAIRYQKVMQQLEESKKNPITTIVNQNKSTSESQSKSSSGDNSELEK